MPVRKTSGTAEVRLIAVGMKPVALITYSDMPGGDALDAPLSPALAAEGLRAEFVCWDDPAVRWTDYRCAVFRSPWNYFHQPEAFAAWLSRAERQTLLLNSAEAVRWNLHKGYLLELRAAGVPTVPTTLLKRGEAPRIEALGITDGVIKPAVSAGAWRTQRHHELTSPEARRQLEALLRDGDVLVQPFQPSVLTEQERSVVFIDGEALFCITKTSAFTQVRNARAEGTPSGTVRAEYAAAALTPEALALGEAAVRAAPGNLLFARADMVRGPEGKLQIMELELFDPSLYLKDFPQAATALAKAIARRVAGGVTP